jgi:hypothetical protein
MLSELINKCYQNYLNIDLKSIHSELNSFSEHHYKNDVKLEIDDLDLEKNPIGFMNSHNEQFKLIVFENKNYLISNSTCYPCSRVYENLTGYRWVEVLIIPDGNAVKITNINSSVRYNFYTLKLFKYLKSFEDIIKFDSVYHATFSKNIWFTQSERIQFLVRSKAKPTQIFKAFQTLQLYNPFQISVISLIDGFPINKNEIQNYLLNNNSIPLAIPYITNPSFKIEISDSTNEIIEKKDFLAFIDSLTDDEVEQFFELEFLEESLNLKNIYPEFKLDILDIKILERAYKSGINKNVSKIVEERLKTINISEKLIREYYKKLKKNLRSIENKIRTNKGYNIVGSLYNESLLFKLIQDAFPHYEIISQYSPEWLGRQRIDIFIKELKIAIEYNGKQHYEPVMYFGGEEGYLKTILRDNNKKKKCTKNGCKLIEIRYDDDLKKMVERIKNETNYINS